jgi:hypothetical protein
MAFREQPWHDQRTGHGVCWRAISPTTGYCWRTPKSRKYDPGYDFFEPRGASNMAGRHVGLRIEIGLPTVPDRL